MNLAGGDSNSIRSKSAESYSACAGAGSISLEDKCQDFLSRFHQRRNHDWLGRDSPAGPRRRNGDSDVEESDVVGAIRVERISRNSFLGLLPRSRFPGQLPLRNRSAGWRGGTAHRRAVVADSRRRSLHVGGADRPGNGGFPHLAAHGGNCREVLVSPESDGRRFYVRPDGSGQPPVVMDRRPAPGELCFHARPPQWWPARSPCTRARRCGRSIGSRSAARLQCLGGQRHSISAAGGRQRPAAGVEAALQRPSSVGEIGLKALDYMRPANRLPPTG